MVSVNTKYLTSVRGILKVLEIISICVAFSCLAEFDRGIYVPNRTYGPRFKYSMVVFVTGWVITLLLYIIFLLGVESMVAAQNFWRIFMLIFSTCFALLFITASGLMADILTQLYSMYWHMLPHLKDHFRVLTASVTCGFLSFALFAMDSLVSCRKVDFGDYSEI